MWITVFALVLAIAIGLTVVALMLQEPETQTTEHAPPAPRQLPRGSELFEPDPKAPLAIPEVAVPRHADRRSHFPEVRRNSARLQKSANPLSDGSALRRRNMSEMMHRLGFDGAFARRNLNLKLVYRTCQKCPVDEACRDWLVRAPKTLTRAPPFCPNAKRFAHATRQAA